MVKVSLLRIIVFALVATAGAAVFAQSWQRTLPANGKVGVLGDSVPLPLVQLNGKSLRFAPGAIIFDASNRTILHAALPPYARVLYTTNPNGDVQRIYILTPVEQELLDRADRR